MTRDEIETEIYEAIYNYTSLKTLQKRLQTVMMKIDKYVEEQVTKARIEVLKNFKAI